MHVYITSNLSPVCVAFSAGSAWAVFHWEAASCYFITSQNMLLMQYLLHPSCQGE